MKQETDSVHGVGDGRLILTGGGASRLGVLLLFGFILFVIAALVENRKLGSEMAKITVAVSVFVFLVIIAMKTTVYLKRNPATLRRETTLLNFVIFSDETDISSMKWAQSRWTASGCMTELGITKWETVTIESHSLTTNEMALSRDFYVSRMDQARNALCGFLSVADLGWEALPKQRKIP